MHIAGSLIVCEDRNAQKGIRANQSFIHSRARLIQAARNSKECEKKKIANLVQRAHPYARSPHVHLKTHYNQYVPVLKTRYVHMVQRCS